MSFFVFTCNPGSEDFLKSEIKNRKRNVTFAFQAPGFVSFKLSKSNDIKPTDRFVFAHMQGKFIKKGEEPVTSEIKPGYKVGHFAVKKGKTEETENWYYTYKSQTGDPLQPDAGASIAQPDEAPSRAYLKLEQAFARHGIPKPQAGSGALEVGCAPGGIVYALLQRGLSVVGVDRAEMAPVIRKNRGFLQIECPVGSWDFEKDREDLENVRWFICDMNSQPRVAARETQALRRYLAPQLKGMVFTMKLNRESFADYIEENADLILKDMRFKHHIVRQLPANQQEVTLIAWND